METINKKLLLTISEMLVKQGLLSEEEKNRLKVMLSNVNVPVRKGGGLESRNL